MNVAYIELKIISHQEVVNFYKALQQENYKNKIFYQYLQKIIDLLKISLQKIYISYPYFFAQIIKTIKKITYFD